jgi:hypothetical protein
MLAHGNNRRGQIPSSQLLRLVLGLSLSSRLLLLLRHHRQAPRLYPRHYQLLDRLMRKYRFGCGGQGSLSCFSLLALFWGVLQPHSLKQVYKRGEMTMPDSLARRQTGDIVFSQDASQGHIQHTQAQLEAVRNLVGMGLTEYSLTYSQVKAFVEKSGQGQSPDFQKYMAERGAALLTTHNMAVDTIIRRAISQTIDTRYVREVEVQRVIEVPQRGIIPRLFSR